jgi:hypothetical protein
MEVLEVRKAAPQARSAAPLSSETGRHGAGPRHVFKYLCRNAGEWKFEADAHEHVTRASPSCPAF